MKSPFERGLRDLHGEDVEMIDVTPTSAGPALRSRPMRGVLMVDQPKRPNWERMFRLWLYAVGFVVSAALAWIAVVILF